MSKKQDYAQYLLDKNEITKEKILKYKKENIKTLNKYDYLEDYIEHNLCNYIKIENGWKKELKICECGGVIVFGECDYCGKIVE